MTHRQQAILYLTHLLVYSDDEYDEREKVAVQKICEAEGISEEDVYEFGLASLEMSEREIFDKGVDMLDDLDEDDKVLVFVWLYKLSEADGTVHAKEVRFLLYSLRRASLDFDIVKERAAAIPSIF